MPKIDALRSLLSNVHQLKSIEQKENILAPKVAPQICYLFSTFEMKKGSKWVTMVEMGSVDQFYHCYPQFEIKKK